MKHTRVDMTPVSEAEKATDGWMSGGTHVWSWPPGTTPEGALVPEEVERYGRSLLEAAVEVKAVYLAASFTKTKIIIEIGMPHALAAETLARRRCK